MILIQLKQLELFALSGYINQVASGIVNSTANLTSGVLNSQMTGASGYLQNLINNISLTGSASNVSGLVSLNFRLVSGSLNSGFNFGQTLPTVPNVLPHIWTTGIGDKILPNVTNQFLTGCSIEYSSRVPDNFYFLNLVAKT